MRGQRENRKAANDFVQNCDWKCSCNRDREIFFLMLWKPMFSLYVLYVLVLICSERNKLLKCHYFYPPLKDSYLFWSELCLCWINVGVISLVWRWDIARFHMSKGRNKRKPQSVYRIELRNEKMHKYQQQISF